MDLPASRDFSEPAEQNKLIINQSHTHTAVVVVGGFVQGLSVFGSHCAKPSVWSCMSRDGGLWTLAVVLLFSPDFMPLLSFTFTQNKQHRACLRLEPALTFFTAFLFLLFPLMFGLFSFSEFLLALPYSPFSLFFSPSSCCWTTFH